MRTVQLSIDEPCNEDWYKMSENDKGRFCTTCQKTVIDFTAMSNNEVVAILQNQSTSVCGRMLPSQLNAPIDLPRKPFPFVRYIVSASLPAFLVATQLQGQQKSDTLFHANDSLGVQSGSSRVRDVGVEAPTRLCFSGRVVDGDGNPLAYATVRFINLNVGVASDSDGRFQLLSPNEGLSIVEVSSVGFVTQEVNLRADVTNLILMQQSVLGLMGEVVIVKTKRKRKSPLQFGLRNKPVRPDFGVYPNPCVRSSSVYIDAGKLPSGIYDGSIANSSGETVDRFLFSIANANQKLPMQIGVWTPGVYFITLIHQKTKNVFTQNIFVR